MATRAAMIEQQVERPAEAEHPEASVRFVWIMIVLCGWLLGGVYLDGWAHNHGKADIIYFSSPGLPSTYTPPSLPSTPAPWHAVFYAGFLTMAAFLGVVLVRNYAKGYHWRRALPPGYELSLLGVLILAAGIVGDLLWGDPFLSQAYLAARTYEPLPELLSPAVLVQGLGILLIVSGPLRAAWLSPSARMQGLALDLPIVLSLTFVLSVLTFITQFAHPFVDPWAARSFHRIGLQSYRRFGEFFFDEAMGVLSIMLQAGLLMGLVLLIIRRRVLPMGSLTIMFTLNAILMSFMQDRYLFIVVAGVAGLAADMLLKKMKPSPRAGEVRLFAFAVPTMYYLLYFLALQHLAGLGGIPKPVSILPAPPPQGGLGWSFDLWVGTVLVAGAVGWLLSYLVMPPVGGWPADAAFTASDQAILGEGSSRRTPRP